MAQPKRVPFRGGMVIEGWPQKVATAQLVACYLFGDKLIPRIRFGRENGARHEQPMRCHDCAAITGEFHVPGCDSEECPVCGDQAFCCACEREDLPGF